MLTVNKIDGNKRQKLGKCVRKLINFINTYNISESVDNNFEHSLTFKNEIFEPVSLNEQSSFKSCSDTAKIDENKFDVNEPINSVDPLELM